MNPLITCNTASFGYGTGRRKTIVQRNISFSLMPGDILVLRGENGAGKSTLLKGLISLASCFSGTVSLQCEKGAYAYVPQEQSLTSDTPATVMDILRMAGISSDKIRAQAPSLPEELKIAPLIQQRFGCLSQGQKKRVLCARALMCSPRALLMDEPLAATDRESAARIREKTLEFCKNGGAAIIASHSDIWGEHTKSLYLKKDGQCG
ncbi:MAG: ATP-binding cassette domain-containing protein [Fibrobacterota bacterium]